MMEFKFKIQQFQTDAVNSIVNVFSGQGFDDEFFYRPDMGTKTQTKFDPQVGSYESNDIAYGNKWISLADDELLRNIREVQGTNEIIQSRELDKSLGRCSLDVEMETGTGKTYVYIKTMFELNKKYGWRKFIIVVPGVAIREGVKKSFETTQNHFMEQYGKKVRYYVYDSSRLQDIDDFSQKLDICALIINSQSFARSLKKDGRSTASRIIYSKRDEFASRRPIDIIAANDPILILDEPQRLGGKATQRALKEDFNALFSINFSATHEVDHNKIYVLDALDAFNKKLVKKIEVKGIEMKGVGGAGKYIYLEDIILDRFKPPRAKIEIEVKRKTMDPSRNTFIMNNGDNLYAKSNGLEAYKGLFITDFDVIKGTITLNDGTTISKGEVIGDLTEWNLRRIQIREAISSHFEKEKSLFPLGIKCLSLFFIDSVSKYRQYDEEGNELRGEYGEIFEEEYKRYLEQNANSFDKEYLEYLERIPVEKTHNGYFSIDRKNRIIDSKDKGEGGSDDENAYNLIMRNKELLLSFKEKTRFIFSHSALREGWDNPNIFQMCALKHTDNTTYLRQEVGRGLRLCVNQEGDRMDLEKCGEGIHDINTLTVVASEGYDKFVRMLQDDTMRYVSDRPINVTSDYFENKHVFIETGVYIIDKETSNRIYFYLVDNKYVDFKGKITDECKGILLEGGLLPNLPDSLILMQEGLTGLVRAASENRDPSLLYADGRRAKIRDNKLNKNFFKDEFQTLWNNINNKYVYSVSFNSNELIQKSINSIDENLRVTPLIYTVKRGSQNDIITVRDLVKGSSFVGESIRTNSLKEVNSRVLHDLVGEIASECTLTRRTIVNILKGIRDEKFQMYVQNPESFIQKVIGIINEQKATTIIDHISYNKTEDKFDNNIFTISKPESDFENVFPAIKHISDYVFTDGLAEKSVERRFVEKLDISEEVCVYAKLPTSFHIPTPVGNYTPDWAIAFNEGAVKHVYFIAETKGSMSSLQLRPIEKAKTECAEKLFENISTIDVKYSIVDSYEELLKIVKG